MNMKQTIILAVAIVLAGIGYGIAQSTTPAAVNGCVYFSTPPTLADKQQYPFTCDSTGKLRVTTS